MSELINVNVRPNDAPEYGLLDTDAGINSSVTREAIKQGVGQLLYKHLKAGGKVVVVDRQTKTVLHEVNIPPLNPERDNRNKQILRAALSYMFSNVDDLNDAMSDAHFPVAPFSEGEVENFAKSVGVELR
jgi:hypothetical protein